MTLPAVTIGFIKVKFPLVRRVWERKTGRGADYRTLSREKANPLQQLTLHIGFSLRVAWSQAKLDALASYGSIFFGMEH